VQGLAKSHEHLQKKKSFIQVVLFIEL
jgi:hypothetical protein